MSPESKRLPCPIRPSQRPCLVHTPSGGLRVEAVPFCRRKGKWCPEAAAVAPPNTFPLVPVRRTHEAPGMEKALPHDVEAEEALLGALLMGGDWFEVYPAYGLVKGDDFYREKNGWVFEAILHCHKQGAVDDRLVAFALGERLSEVGGRDYLAYLWGRVPTPYHAVPYARIVKELAERRRAIEKAGQKAGDAWGGKAEASLFETVNDGPNVLP